MKESKQLPYKCRSAKVLQKKLDV